ncbi:MAG: FAD-dependent oxidoreductase [Synechococcales cyanobacterium]
MTQVVIVGSGPTGVTLARCLGQQGIPVILIEAAKDLRRLFRGEALMPSGLEALAQMGLTEILTTVPHRPLTAWEFVLDQQSFFRVAEPMGQPVPCTLVSQPPFLAAVRQEALSYPSVSVLSGIPVRDLIWQQGRVAGVTLADGRGIPADLVIGADGRHSLVRERAQLSLITDPQPIEVYWFRLPLHPAWERENVFLTVLGGRQGFAVFRSAEGETLHLAWIHPAQAVPPDRDYNWGDVLAAISPPWFADHCRTSPIEPPQRLVPLVGRCPQWHRPGLLLLGDAAHPMSPVRAQGINMALRDVIVTVNRLLPYLKDHPHPERWEPVLSQIQAERDPEIQQIQRLQAQELAQGERLRRSPWLRYLLGQSPPLLRQMIQQHWQARQQKLRTGTAPVLLMPRV